MFKGIFFKLCCISAILIAGAFSLQAKPFKQAVFEEKFISFNLPAEKDRLIVAKTVVVDEVKENKVYAYANKKQLREFKELGYDFEILTNPGDVNPKSITMATTVAGMANWDRYPTYELYTEMMEKWVADYPDLCKLENIGTSQQGRDLWVLKISDNVNVEEAEPEFFYTSTMHGDETTGFVLYLRLIDYLLSNYGSDDRVTNMVNNMEIWINPDANPDGTYTNDNSTVFGARRSLANNVDPNRNFHDPEDGEHPDGNAWAPETVAMMNFAGAHNFTLSANAHGGIELVNYPWDTWERRHPDNAWFLDVSTDYATLAQNNSPDVEYFLGQGNGVTNGFDWYTTEGCRQDYMNYFHSCREITLELSGNKLLSSSELPAHWNYNKLAMLGFMEECLYGIKGIVDDTEGNPVLATVTVVGHDTDMDRSAVKSDIAVGDYHRMLSAGTYTLEFSADGFEPVTRAGVVVADGEVVIENVTMTAYPEDDAPVVSNLSGTSAVTGKDINISVDVYDVHQVEYVKAVYTIEGVTNTINLTSNKKGSRPSSVYSCTIPAQAFEVSGTVKFLTKDNQGNEGISETYAISWIDLLTEGFETADFAALEWSFSGSSDWAIDNSTSHSGSKSAKSGVIGDSQHSDLILNLDLTTSGNINFFKKVSSEDNYDKLKFYIDNMERGSWSGNDDWSPESYELTAGSHTLKWEYAKDSGADNGSDCAWIDDIEILGASSPADTSPPTVVSFSGNSIIEGNDMGLTLKVSDETGITSTIPATYTINGNTLELVLTKSKDIDTFTGVIPACETATSGTISFTITDTSPAGNSDFYGPYDIFWTPSDISEILPKNTELYQNYPNPFNPATTIKFFNKLQGDVKLTIFNAKGEVAASLVNGYLNSRFHNITFDASRLNSGIYYYKLETPEKTIIKKMMLIK